MIRISRKRGFVFLGLAAILVFTGAMAAMVLDRSLESYRSAAQLEYRLAARAAAESAALFIAERRSLPAGFDVGGCLVAANGDRLDVSVRSRKGGELFRQSFNLILDRKEQGPWRIAGLRTVSR